MLIDVEEGWRYGFPKKAPENYKEPEFDLHTWLVAEGYPPDKESYYVRYIAEEGDDIT